MTLSTPSTPDAAAPALVSRLAVHPRLGPLAQRFARQLGEKLDAMDALAATADGEALAAQAHWLKGTGGSMGYDDLVEPSLALEIAARQSDFTQANAHLAALRGVCARMLAGLTEPA